MAITGGQPIHGEFSSADATALSESAGRFVLYGQGSTDALTLNANDYVMIHQITISSAATNALVQVYDGANNAVGAGEEIHGGIVGTNTTVNVPLPVPHTCQKGTYPKVIASAAGNVRAQFRGTILRVGT